MVKFYPSLALVAALAMNLLTSAHADDWCDQPLTSVCSGPLADHGRQVGFDQIVAQAKAQAQATMRNGPFGIFPAFDQYILKFRTQQSLARMAAIWETSITEGQMVDAAAGYLLKAIDLEVSGGRLSEESAQKMKAEIGSIAYFPASELLDWIAANPDREAELPALADTSSRHARLAQALVSECDPDGRGDQAFFLKSGAKKFMIVCPGTLLRNAAATHSNQELFESLLFVFTHELGHAIDSDAYLSSYGGIQSCLKSEFLKDLLPEGSKETEVGEGFFATQRFAEITADFWGARVQMLYLKELDSVDSRRSAIRRGWQILCGPRDAEAKLIRTNVHPLIQTRFAISIGRDREARELLGCSALPRAGSCGLVGVR